MAIPGSVLSCLIGTTTAPQSLVAGNRLPPTKINAPFFFPFQHLSEVMLGRWDSFSRKEKGGVGD